MKLDDIIKDIQFRDFKFEIYHDKFQDTLMISSRFMDREESKEYYNKKEPHTIWQSDDLYSLPDRNYMPPNRAKVGLPYMIPQHFNSINMALEFILHCIRQVEDHEMHEDFYYRGERVFDPHIKK